MQAEWDSIVCTSASATTNSDDTLPFNRLESGSSLYRVDTVATVAPGTSENATAPAIPHFFATAAGQAVCIVINKQVHVFSAMCEQLLATLNLESAPEAVAFSDDSSFLVLGDQAGTLHVLCVSTKTMLYSQQLVDPTHSSRSGLPLFTSILFANTSSTSYELIVAASAGTTYRFTGLDLVALNEAIVQRDMALGKQVKAAIRVEHVEMSSAHAKALLSVHSSSNFGGASPCAPHGKNTLLASGTGLQGFSVWRRNASDTTIQCDQLGSSLFANAGGIAHSRTTADGRLLIILSTLGEISVWSTLTMLKLDVFNSLVDDFELVESNNQSRLILLGLPKPTEPGKSSTASMRMLYLLDLPSLSEVYSVSVPHVCALVHNSVAREQFFLIEGHQFNTADPQLCVRMLSETLPTNRFYQLLHKGRFQEALQFAKQFQMEEDLVHRVHATHIVDSALRSGFIPEHDLKTLQTTLSSIQDIDFVTEFCVKATLPTLESTQALLAHARTMLTAKMPQLPSRAGPTANSLKRGEETAEESESCKAATLLELIATTLFQLSTFHLIARGGKFSGRLWQMFRSASPHRVMCSLLATGNICSASVVWRRHILGAPPKTGEDGDSLELLLYSIPDSTKSSDYLWWLEEDLIPSIDNADDAFVLKSWCLARAQSLETTEPNEWPANSIHLLKTVYLCGLSTFDNSLPPMARAARSDLLLIHGSSENNTAAEEGSDLALDSEIRTMLLKLEDLQVLRDAHSLRLSLSESLQESPASIALQLLDRVAAPELIPEAIEKHMKVYAARHHLNLNTLLLEYCVELMEGASGSGSVLNESPWEIRVLAVLSCISHLDTKIDVVLELMRHVQVPWSQAVEQIIQATLAVHHRRLSELREQYRLMQLKLLLVRYNATSFNVSDVGQARGLLHRVLRHVHLTEAMEDGLRVVQAYNHLTKSEAYSSRCQYLCLADKIPEIITILESIDEPEAIVEDFCRWCDCLLEESCILPTDRKQHQIVSNAAAAVCVLMTKQKSATNHDTRNWQLRSDAYRFTSMLELEFNVQMSPESYQDEEQRRELLKRVVAQYSSNSKSSSLTVSNGPASVSNRTQKRKKDCDSVIDTQIGSEILTTDLQLYRLSELLGFHRDDLRFILANEAAEYHNYSMAMAVCEDLIDRVPGAQTASTLKHVAYLLADACAQSPDQLTEKEWLGAPAVLSHYATQATTMCNVDELADCLELYRGAFVVLSVEKQCDKGDDEAVDTIAQHAFASSLSMNIADETEGVDGADEDVPQSWHDAQHSAMSISHFSHRFREQGLVLQASDAIPLACRFFVSLFPCGVHAWQQGERFPFQQDGLCGKGLSASTSLISAVTQPRKRSAGTDLHAGSPLALISKCGREMIVLAKDNQLPFMALQSAVLTVVASTGYLATEAHLSELELDIIGEQSKPIIAGLMQMLSGQCMSSRHIDHDAALGFLLAVEEKLAFNSFRTALASVSRDYKRLRAIALLGMDCGRFWANARFVADCQKLARNSSWWVQLKHLHIAFDDALFQQSLDGSYQKQLVPKLVSASCADVQLAIQFANAYSIPEDYVIFACAEYIIQRRDVTRLQHCRDQLRSLAAMASSQALFAAHIRAVCLPMVSSYDYASLRLILGVNLHLLQQALLQSTEDIELVEFDCAQLKRQLLLLDVLQHYERSSMPSKDEEQLVKVGLAQEHPQAILYVHGEKTPASLLASKLPFHALLTEDPWTVLSAELNLDTVSKLLPVARILALSADQFYITAIENALHVDKHSRPCFAKLRPLIMLVRDDELAVITAKNVSDCYDAADEDKTAALLCAEELARRWRSHAVSGTEQQERADKTLARLSDICRRTSVVQKLSAAGLNHSPYCELSGNPTELFQKLYEGEASRCLGRQPAVTNLSLQKLIEECAKLFENFDLDKLRRRLLGAWLVAEESTALNHSDQQHHYPQQEISDDTTTAMHVDFSKLLQQQAAAQLSHRLRSHEHSIGLSDGGVYLQRIVFMLRHGNAGQKGVEFMLNYAFCPEQGSTKITYASRFRALQALFCAVPVENILKVTGQSDSQALKDSMAQFAYLSALAALGSPQTMKTFDACSKVGLAKALWRDHQNNPRAIRICSDLCLDYQCYDVRLWTGLLQQLLQFGELDYLRHVLSRLMGIASLRHLSCVSNTWMAILKQDLATLEVQPEISRQMFSCLQSVPFAGDIDMRPVHKKLMKLKLYSLAFEAAVLIKQEEDRLACILSLALDHGMLLPVLDWLANLKLVHKNSPASVELDDLQCQLFESINDAGSFALLLPTRHWKSFVKFSVEEHRIDALLLASLKANQLQNAASLVASYYNHHLELAPKVSEGEEPAPPMSSLQLLQHYVEKSEAGNLKQHFEQATRGGF